VGSKEGRAGWVSAVVDPLVAEPDDEEAEDAVPEDPVPEAGVPEEEAVGMAMGEP
jgi:hypothetical protein